MPKKNFKENISHLDRFFSESDETHRTHNTDSTHETYNTDKTHEAQSEQNFSITQPQNPPEQKYYRLNLKLKAEHKEYLAEASWKARKSITEYINDLIETDKATQDT